MMKFYKQFFYAVPSFAQPPLSSGCLCPSLITCMEVLGGLRSRRVKGRGQDHSDEILQEMGPGARHSPLATCLSVKCFQNYK